MIISNSRVDTWLRCKRLHYYSYVLGWSPKTVSHPNSVGNLGHHIMERYYRLQMDGNSREDAFHGSLELLTDAYGHETPEVIDLVMDRFGKYHKYYAEDDFKIVNVEGKFFVPLNGKNTFGMTLDLLVEFQSGPRRGMAIMDHKFKYNFDNNDELSMHVQTLKYKWGLNQIGYSVKRSVLNQIRYRQDIKDPLKLFKRQDVSSTPVQEKNIMEEHLKVSDEIIEASEKSLEWQADHSPRRLYSKDCGGCYFRIPCRQELLGVDPEPTLKSMFTKVPDTSFYKPYGYEDD